MDTTWGPVLLFLKSCRQRGDILPPLKMKSPSYTRDSLMINFENYVIHGSFTWDGRGERHLENRTHPPRGRRNHSVRRGSGPTWRSKGSLVDCIRTAKRSGLGTGGYSQLHHGKKTVRSGYVWIPTPLVLWRLDETVVCVTNFPRNKRLPNNNHTTTTDCK